MKKEEYFLRMAQYTDGTPHINKIYKGVFLVHKENYHSGWAISSLHHNKNIHLSNLYDRLRKPYEYWSKYVLNDGLNSVYSRSGNFNKDDFRKYRRHLIWKIKEVKSLPYIPRVHFKNLRYRVDGVLKGPTATQQAKQYIDNFLKGE